MFIYNNNSYVVTLRGQQFLGTSNRFYVYRIIMPIARSATAAAGISAASAAAPAAARINAALTPTLTITKSLLVSNNLLVA